MTAGIFEQAGTTGEKRVAQRVVKAVLSELPYAANGAIQSCAGIAANGEFQGHWGRVTSVGTLDLASNLDGKVNSSVPWYSRTRIIARDMNLDGTLQYGAAGVGTPDDQDGNGTLDFDQWANSGDVEDPWLKFWSEGDITSGGKALSPGCATSECQPMPFYQSPSTFGTGPTDHSNFFKNVAVGLCPDYDYALWKEVAQSGAPNTFYYRSDGAGTGTWKLNGSGTSVDFVTATNGHSGLFFFDTADNLPPRDADSNGVFDNLADTVSINGGGWQAAGFIYLNAGFGTTGTGNTTTQRQLVAPAEPYIDSNGNGMYDDTEFFLDLTYPGSSTGTYAVNGMRRVADGYTRQDPPLDTSGTAGKWNANVNMYGLFYATGIVQAQGNYIYFGSMISKSGAAAPGFSGTPDYFYDERMERGLWPPSDMGLPRTMITAWQTE